jgi:hypothetical protein
MQFLSIGLWIVGLVLVLFVASDDVRARLLGLGFLMASLTAAVGGASGWNSFWGASTFQKVLMCLVAPLLIAAHLTFPAVTLPKYRKVIIYSVSIAAILLAALLGPKIGFQTAVFHRLGSDISRRFCFSRGVGSLVWVFIYNRFARDAEPPADRHYHLGMMWD